MRLIGKTVVITGGTRGIGRYLVEASASEGANVIFTGRNHEAVTKTAETLQSQHSTIRVIGKTANACSPEDMGMVASYAAQEFGNIDVLFLNAATNNAKGAVGSMAHELWLQGVTENIQALFIPASCLVRLMTEKGGNVISIGSHIGHAGVADNSAYAVSKGAAWAFAQSLALELKNFDVNVNELIPGPTKTDMNPGASGPQWKLPEALHEMAMVLATQDLQHGATGQSWAMKRV